MSYIMSCLGWFNRLTVWHLSFIDRGFSRITFRDLIRDWVPGTRFNTPSYNLMVWGIFLTKSEVCIYRGRIWRWRIGGWCFVKKPASLSFPLSQYNIIFSSNSLSRNQCHFISHVFERFGFIPSLKTLLL